MTPTFSIILPTCNRPEALAACLDALSAQSIAADEYEIIVTDDGSPSDGLKQRFPRARWVEGPRRGPAANRNNGARAASAPWLVFIDDDCVPRSEWLAAYRAALGSHPDIRVFEGRVFAERERRDLRDFAPLNERGGYLWSCNFAIDRDLFLALGGFDERFRYAAMEDVELRCRLKVRALEFRFVPDAGVCHPWRIRKGWRELAQQRDSTRLFLTLHPEERRSLGPGHFIHAALYGFARFTLPDLLRGRGRGLHLALLEHLSYLDTALRIFFDGLFDSSHRPGTAARD